MSTDTKTVKYDFRPGITRETTPYAAEGGGLTVIVFVLETVSRRILEAGRKEILAPL